jgi:hypothetical protein
MRKHLASALRIGKYLLRARQQAVDKFPLSDPRHGMIYGPAEHDTCDMGTASHGKPATPVVDGQYMLYYFSVSMWSWRGMVELGNLLHDYSAGQDDLAWRLLSEAGRFKKDIDCALNSSVVRDESTDKVIFVPCAVVPTGTTAKPYTSMTVDIVASYSNFR